MKTKLLIIELFLLVLTLIITACTPSTSPAASDNSSSAVPVDASLDGKALVETRCTQCHVLEKISTQAKSMEGWTTTVDRMIGKGAKINEAEKEAVITYLAETYK